MNAMLPMTPKTFTVLSEMSSDTAQIFFASVFISPLISHVFSTYLVCAGLLLSLIFWYLSILLANKSSL
jgi:hypothetical protein